MKQEYKPLYEKFGLNVVYYRKRKKLTQLQLAELIDIDRSHISAIELGNVGVSFDVNILQFPALTLCNSANGGKALIFRRFRHLPFGRVIRISRRIPA